MNLERLQALLARDLLTDEVFEIKARLVINTTGPWSDKVRMSNDAEQYYKCVQPREFTW